MTTRARSFVPRMAYRSPLAAMASEEIPLWKIVELRSHEFHRAFVVVILSAGDAPPEDLFWSSRHVMITFTRLIATGGWTFTTLTGVGGASGFCSWGGD